MNGVKVGSMAIDEKAMQKALAAKGEGNNYIGAGDNLLDFRNGSSFIDENATGKNFTVTITNGASSDCKVQLHSILSGTQSGYNLLKEGTVTTSVTCNGKPNSADLLIEYLKKYPTRVNRIKFSVSDASQLDEDITLLECDVFGSEKKISVTPSTYQGAETQNPKMVALDATAIPNWTLSDRATLLYNVVAGKTVTLTISFGASVDTHAALQKKADEAKDTVAAAYVRKKNA